MKILTEDQYKKIPNLPQTQVSLNDQLTDLIMVSVKLGFYDAANYLQSLLLK